MLEVTVRTGIATRKWRWLCKSLVALNDTSTFISISLIIFIGYSIKIYLIIPMSLVKETSLLYNPNHLKRSNTWKATGGTSSTDRQTNSSLYPCQWSTAEWSQFPVNWRDKWSFKRTPPHELLCTVLLMALWSRTSYDRWLSYWTSTEEASQIRIGLMACITISTSLFLVRFAEGNYLRSRTFQSFE